MINNVFKILLSLLMFYFAYLIIVTNVFPIRGERIALDNPFFYYPLGLLFFIFGLLILFHSINFKISKTIFSKCPKCKEVFNYNELIDGKCKYCKEVDTIDIDEYFKKYPNESKKKEK